jgi:hypothetical protein
MKIKTPEPYQLEFPESASVEAELAFTRTAIKDFCNRVASANGHNAQAFALLMPLLILSDPHGFKQRANAIKNKWESGPPVG